MFKRLLPAISLASGYVDRDNGCSADVWRTRVRRKWTRLARELSEAAGLEESPATRAQCCASARTSIIARASPCPRPNNLGASGRDGRDGDAWTKWAKWTKWTIARRGNAGPWWRWRWRSRSSAVRPDTRTTHTPQHHPPTVLYNTESPPLDFRHAGQAASMSIRQ
jgi:hypothetical protein